MVASVNVHAYIPYSSTENTYQRTSLILVISWLLKTASSLHSLSTPEFSWSSPFSSSYGTSVFIHLVLFALLTCPYQISLFCSIISEIFFSTSSFTTLFIFISWLLAPIFHLRRQDFWCDVFVCNPNFCCVRHTI